MRNHLVKQIDQIKSQMSVKIHLNLLNQCQHLTPGQNGTLGCFVGAALALPVEPNDNELYSIHLSYQFVPYSMCVQLRSENSITLADKRERERESCTRLRFMIVFCSKHPVAMNARSNAALYDYFSGKAHTGRLHRKHNYTTS